MKAKKVESVKLVHKTVKYSDKDTKAVSDYYTRNEYLQFDLTRLSGPSKLASLI